MLYGTQTALQMETHIQSHSDRVKGDFIENVYRLEYLPQNRGILCGHQDAIGHFRYEEYSL